MPKFAANLSMLFQEHAFLDRFEAASNSGFRHIEYLFPYDYRSEALKELLDQHHLEQVLFNLPPGDWNKGERGVACLPNRRDEFKRGVEQAIHYAEVLKVPRVNCLAGILPTDHSSSEAWDCLIENVEYAADQLKSVGIKLVVEAINSKIDMPGFCLDTIEKSQALLNQLNHENLGFQFDLYHMHTMHGDLIRSLDQIWQDIAHVQFADSPGRHEPGTGDIDFSTAFEHLDKQGYTGFVSAEYRPKDDTVSSLAWLRTFN